MNSIVGFTLTSNLSITNKKRASATQQKALDHFPWLTRQYLNLGNTNIEVWGHDDLSDMMYRLPDGSMLILVGSPIGAIEWSKLEDQMLSTEPKDDLELSWEGRFVLLKLSADGTQWTMWNDWLGSIPVFHARSESGYIASTLEPVVVAAKNFNQNDIYLPGLISLLIHGHFMSDWTLFQGMETVPADTKAEWHDQQYCWKRCSTVQPSEARWESGWDELVDEMHELSRQAIVNALKTQNSWILPLSSGLDSRLIAAVGAHIGADITTFTWGAKESSDTAFAHQIAKTLKLPWQWIEFKPDFMVKYTQPWANIFGSAMDFHGIYLMPFLDVIKSEFENSYLLGFMGEALAGFDVKFQTELHSSSNTLYQIPPDRFTRWLPTEVRSLLRLPTDNAFEEVAVEIQNNLIMTTGSWFQRLRYLTFWNRQRLFTNFQSTLCSYWQGVATPFLDKDYARFCMSLPRAVLEERRLQADVFRRYFPDIARIPGTYAGDPYILRGDFLLKRRLSNSLPRFLQPGFLKTHAIHTNPRPWDEKCLRASEYSAIWPIGETREVLGNWLNLDIIDKTYKEALSGNRKSLMKLKAIQPLALRFLDYSLN